MIILEHFLVDCEKANIKNRTLKNDHRLKEKTSESSIIDETYPSHLKTMEFKETI